MTADKGSHALERVGHQACPCHGTREREGRREGKRKHELLPQCPGLVTIKGARGCCLPAAHALYSMRCNHASRVKVRSATKHWLKQHLWNHLPARRFSAWPAPGRSQVSRAAMA